SRASHRAKEGRHGVSVGSRRHDRREDPRAQRKEARARVGGAHRGYGRSQEAFALRSGRAVQDRRVNARTRVHGRALPNGVPQGSARNDAERRSEMFMSRPKPTIVVRVLEPPYENSGKVMPTTGSTPTVMPTLNTVCQKNIAPMPTATAAPKRSFASAAM